MEPGFGKRPSPQVIFQGTLETGPPAQELWLAYRLPVSGGSSERLLGFQHQVCDSGDVGDPEGRWVALLRIGSSGIPTPWLSLWPGTGWESEKLCLSPPLPSEIGLPQSPLVLPPSHPASLAGSEEGGGSLAAPRLWRGPEVRPSTLSTGRAARGCEGFRAHRASTVPEQGRD